MAEQREILILVGSPRKEGKSAALAAAMGEVFKQAGAKVCAYPLAEYPVAACTGCNSCSVTGECMIVNDGFGVLSRHMDSCDAAVVISPVYFAGPTSWLKAALDRCQVYWARRYVLGQGLPPERPAHLIAVGDGGDPFGFEPLVTICTSALNSTGLRIGERVHDYTGDAFSEEEARLLAARIIGELP